MNKIIIPVLIAVVLLLGGCANNSNNNLPGNLANYSLTDLQKLFGYLSKESTKTTCDNTDYQTQITKINSPFLLNDFWVKDALTYGLNTIDLTLLKNTDYVQLDYPSHIKFGRALAWQLCNGNSYFTDEALRNSDITYNLIMNVNSPLCAIWQDPIDTGDNFYDTPYQTLIDDPNVPGVARVKNYSAAATLEGLDCIESLSFPDAINVAITVPVSPYKSSAPLTGLFADLETIAEYLPKLVRLDISKAYVADMSQITKLKNLEYLIMNGVVAKTIDQLNLFPDTPVSALTRYPAFLEKLKILDLSNTDAGYLTYLADLADLRMLNLSRTRTTDLDGIKTLVKLRYLDVSDTKIKSIKLVHYLKQLVYLNISKTDISDLSPIKNLDQLKEINISNLKDISSSEITALKDLKSLNKITATGTLDKEGCKAVKSILTGITVVC